MSIPGILVTGSQGQLGSELQVLARTRKEYRFDFFDRESFPIQDESTVRTILEKYRPALLLNCAAYTAVDQAEKEPDLAREINGYAVGNLARICRDSGIRFVHISTDYVFNGNSDRPWKEDDEVDPVNAYGASKLLGEKLAFDANPDSLIIRTSWVYSSFGKNFVKTMIRLMKEKSRISVVNDQQGAPTYAADLAAALLEIAGQKHWRPGIYHYSNRGSISWYEFALEIRRALDLSCTVEATDSKGYPTPARRPQYSVLDTSRIERDYGIRIRDWKSALADCLAILRKAEA